MQAISTATGINTEERLLGWAATKFPQLTTFSARLAPLVELWALAVGFFDTQLAWLNAPLPSLNSIIIGQEVASCLDRLTELEKVKPWSFRLHKGAMAWHCAELALIPSDCSI